MDEMKAEVWKQAQARDVVAISAELAQIVTICARTMENCVQKEEPSTTTPW
jgi:hypothetical protein